MVPHLCDNLDSIFPRSAKPDIALGQSILILLISQVSIGCILSHPSCVVMHPLLWPSICSLIFWYVLGYRLVSVDNIVNICVGWIVYKVCSMHWIVQLWALRATNWIPKGISR